MANRGQPECRRCVQPSGGGTRSRRVGSRLAGRRWQTLGRAWLKRAGLHTEAMRSQAIAG